MTSTATIPHPPIVSKEEWLAARKRHLNSLLDVTPYGRQEDWEDSPKGWPQEPTYG